MAHATFQASISREPSPDVADPARRGAINTNGRLTVRIVNARSRRLTGFNRRMNHNSGRLCMLRKMPGSIRRRVTPNCSCLVIAPLCPACPLGPRSWDTDSEDGSKHSGMARHRKPSTSMTSTKPTDGQHVGGFRTFERRGKRGIGRPPTRCISCQVCHATQSRITVHPGASFTW